jgi:hypothetical protein
MWRRVQFKVQFCFKLVPGPLSKVTLILCMCMQSKSIPKSQTWDIDQTEPTAETKFNQTCTGDVEERKSLLQCFFSPWGSSTFKSLIRSVNTISTAPQNCTFYMSPIACLTPFFAYQFCNAKSILWSALLVKDCTRAKLLPLSLHSLYNEHYSLVKLQQIFLLIL